MNRLMNPANKILFTLCILLLIAFHAHASEFHVAVDAGVSGNTAISGSGLHNNSLMGPPVYENTEIKNVNTSRINSRGINARYFINNMFGLDLHMSHNTTQLLEQRVILQSPRLSEFTQGQGLEVSQPAADLRFTQLYLGPVVRYKKDSGIWNNLNLYLGCGPVYSWGSVNNTYYDPKSRDRYGEEGESSLYGFAFSAKTGMAYNYRNLLAGIEFKYVKGTLQINQFRSFNNDGLDVSLTYYSSVLSVGKQF